MANLEPVDYDPFAATQPSGNVPRGIRNNNPLNIEAGNFTASQPGFQGSDGRFARFADPEQGFAAAESLLGIYGRKHGLRTISEVINRWAPPSDGNPVSAYADSVARQVGVGPNDPIDLANPQVRSRLSSAMATFENGRPVPRATDISAQSQQPAQQPQLTPVDHDPFAPTADTFSGRFGEFEKPKNVSDLETGLRGAARSLTTGPSRGRMSDILQGYINQGAAASQGTTPNVAAQSKNLISADTFESDAGELQYRDPQTGQIVTTDQNKHVALRDPADGRIKVYARTEDTNEGRLSSAGRLLGMGMATGAPTQAASRVAVAATRAPEAAAAALTPGQEVSQAAQRLAVDLPKAVTTDSMATQRVASAVRNIPGAGDPLIKATGRAVQQLGNKASEVASEFGGGTIAGSGDAAKGAIKNYIVGKSAETSSKFYNRVDELVDNSVLSPMPNTTTAAQEILARRNAAAVTGQSEAVKRIEEATTRPQGMTYEGIKDLRSYLRELKDNPSVLPADLSAKELNKIYDGVTADLKGAVRNAGGDKALVAFDRANKHYSLLSKRREDLAKITGQNADAPAERVFDRLAAMASGTSRADINGLMQARKAIGADDWNEFVSGVIANMGRSPAAKGAPESLQGVDFSPERFLTSYNKLSDAGRNALFRSGGKSNHADALKDIAVVSSRFRELQKFSNPSGTAQATIGAATGTGSVMPLFYGDVVTPLAMLGTVLTGRGLATALARPASASSVAKVARAQESLVRLPSPATIAAFNMATRNLISTLGAEAKGLSPADFLKALQGPVPSRASDEKQ